MMHIGVWGWGHEGAMIGASGGGIPDSLVVWIVSGGSTDMMPALEPIAEVADYMDSLRSARNWF